MPKEQSPEKPTARRYSPKEKAAANRRLDRAADVLVQTPLGMALDDNIADNVAPQAIIAVLDRADSSVKTALNVSVEPAPWEVVWESISGGPRPDPLGRRDGAATNTLAVAAQGGKQ
jgi:hypothetical protein